MAPYAWGRGAEGRIVLGMFWKSEKKGTYHSALYNKTLAICTLNLFQYTRAFPKLI